MKKPLNDDLRLIGDALAFMRSRGMVEDAANIAAAVERLAAALDMLRDAGARLKPMAEAYQRMQPSERTRAIIEEAGELLTTSSGEKLATLAIENQALRFNLANAETRIADQVRERLGAEAADLKRHCNRMETRLSLYATGVRVSGRIASIDLEAVQAAQSLT